MTEEKKTEQKNKAERGDARGGRRERGGERVRRERGGERVRRGREPRARSEFDHKTIDVRRVTRVVAGGRRFSFSVSLVLGDGKGQVGVGLGKAADTALAIEKATMQAKRALIRVPLVDGAIPHDTEAKYAAARVVLFPRPGKGLKAGSAVRTVLELAGVRNVSAKILSRSTNPLNNARATVLALKALRSTRRRVQKEESKTK